jgi:hypothetical protein
MTRSTCCGGLSSENPDVNESTVPYPIRNCFSAPNSQWNKSECNNHCCGGGGSCVPTEDGGYCKYQDTYFKYDDSKSKYEIPRSDTRSLKRYPSDFEEVHRVEDITIDKYYKRRLYDNTREKVIRDMFNRDKEREIMSHKNWGEYNDSRNNFDQKQRRYRQRYPILEETTGVSIFLGVLVYLCLLCVVAYLLMHLNIF